LCYKQNEFRRAGLGFSWLNRHPHARSFDVQVAKDLREVAAIAVDVPSSTCKGTCPEATPGVGLPGRADTRKSTGRVVTDGHGPPVLSKAGETESEVVQRNRADLKGQPRLGPGVQPCSTETTAPEAAAKVRHALYDMHEQGSDCPYLDFATCLPFY
jgi:hypothetical protein